MSCIVSLIRDDELYMASDSGVFIDDHKIPSAQPEKMFWKGVYLFGLIGSVRCNQIVRYGVPTPVVSEDPIKYLSTEFAFGIRKALAEGGRDETDEDGSDVVSAGILAGTRHGGRPRLYLFGHDYSVLEIKKDFYAVGCGAEYVIGYLEATRDSSEYPEVLLEKALDIASEYTIYVRKPFRVVKLSERPYSVWEVNGV